MYKAGDIIENDFLIVSIEKKIDKKSKPYLDLIIKNKFIDCSAKLWDAYNYTEESVKDYVNKCVRIKGEFYQFNNSPQIRIENIELNNDQNLQIYTDLFKYSNYKLDDLINILKENLKLVENPILKELNEKLLKNNKIINKFIIHPAAKRIHHEYMCGLLEHTVSMMILSKNIQSHFNFLNLDLLISGCLWHDVGKIYETEFKDKVNIEYSFEGKIFSHMNIGVDILSKIGTECGYLDKEEFKLLKHMILSHHGKKEWGASVLPTIPEAKFLFFVDYCDAYSKIMYDKLSMISTNEFIKKDNIMLTNEYYRHSFFNDTEIDYFSLPSNNPTKKDCYSCEYQINYNYNICENCDINHSNWTNIITDKGIEKLNEIINPLGLEVLNKGEK